MFFFLIKKYIYLLAFFTVLFGQVKNNKSYFQVKAEANHSIDKILDILNKQKEKSIYSKQYIKIINSFKKDPEKFKILPSPKIPDGSPIGTGTCYYND